MTAPQRTLSLPAKLLLMAITTTLMVGVLEGLLKLTGIGQPPENYDAPKVLQKDPELGWTNKPGTEDEFRLERDAIHSRVVTDAHGLRIDPEAPERDYEGFRTLLLVGDSVTAGFEVAARQTYGALLEERLIAAGHRIRVLNGGVRGYGTDQSLLRLQQLMPVIEPDYVLYMFCINDPGDNLAMKKLNQGVSKPLLVENDAGEWEWHNRPTAPMPKGVFAHYEPRGADKVFVEGSVRGYGLRAFLQKNSYLYRQIKKLTRPPPPSYAPSKQKTAYAEAPAAANGKGGTPTTNSYEDRLIKELVGRMHHTAPAFAIGLSDYSKTLLAFGGEAGIPVLPLYELGEDVVFDFDPHWNVKGHALAAEKLAEFVIDIWGEPTDP